MAGEVDKLVLVGNRCIKNQSLRAAAQVRSLAVRTSTSSMIKSYDDIFRGISLEFID